MSWLILSVDTGSAQYVGLESIMFKNLPIIPSPIILQIISYCSYIVPLIVLGMSKMHIKLFGN